MESMNDAYDLVQEGTPLQEIEKYKKLFKAMACQTIECGYFIQEYLGKGFCKIPNFFQTCGNAECYEQ